MLRLLKKFGAFTLGGISALMPFSIMTACEQSLSSRNARVSSDKADDQETEVEGETFIPSETGGEARLNKTVIKFSPAGIAVDARVRLKNSRTMFADNTTSAVQLEDPAGDVIELEVVDASTSKLLARTDFLSTFSFTQVIEVSVAEEERRSSDRDLIRSRKFLVETATSIKNHISSMCKRQGWNYREEYHWRGPARRLLEQLY
jgi:hypothetical protein